MINPARIAISSSHLRLLLCLVASVALPLFSGCVSAPVTHKIHPTAAEKIARVRVQAAPLDVEVQQISAGGMTEKNDELTARVGNNIAASLSKKLGLPFDDAAKWQTGSGRATLDDVQALLRHIHLNELMPLGGPVVSGTLSARPLSYNVGPIDEIADALGAEVVLFVLLRDQYSTGGRKAVMALAMLAGAAAGVAVTPAMGTTVSYAALVDRDGTVLWYNQLGAAGQDLRTAAGAQQWIEKLFSGFPTLPDVSASNELVAQSAN